MLQCACVIGSYPMEQQWDLNRIFSTISDKILLRVYRSYEGSKCILSLAATISTLNNHFHISSQIGLTNFMTFQVVEVFLNSLH